MPKTPPPERKSSDSPRENDAVTPPPFSQPSIFKERTKDSILGSHRIVFVFPVQQPVEGGVVKEEWTINYDDLEFAEVQPPPPL